MSTVFILCSIDPASSNIGSALISRGGFEKEAESGGKLLYRGRRELIVSIDSIHIHREKLDSEIEKDFGIRPDRMVFMSTHRSVSNTPAITFHPIGNYGDAELGGEKARLVPSMPEIMTGGLLAMSLSDHTGYQVTFEATHHGPLLEVPAMFVEIGSDENAWHDGRAGESVARVLDGLQPSEGVNAIGVGGGHYCARFKDIASRRLVNFGHFIPNHSLPSIDDSVAAELLEKSPRTEHFAVYEDRKNLKEIERVASLLEAQGLKRLEHSGLPLRQ